MRQLIFLLFLFPIIAFGQQSPTQILNTPWQKINYKLEVGQRLLLPADTLSYPPGATVRDTTRLLAFAPNGNLYKLWNGVWSLIGAGGGTNVQLLGDSAIVVGDDTIRVKPITFESDMPPAYFFKDGDTIRDYTLQYLNDSVKIRKSSDTLFFPNGDTVLLGAAGIPDATKTNRGLVNISTQQFAGLKQFTSGISIGDSSSDGSRIATWFNRFGGGRIAGTIRGSSVVTDNYWDFQPGNVGAIGRLLSPSGAEVLTWQDSVFAGIITASRYNVSWQDSSFAPFVGKIYGKADGKVYYLNGKGQDYDLTGGGGSGTVTSGYGISGDGSGGNPLRVDSATLRGDYIRNQYAAKENKSAWFTKARLDSLYSTKIALGAIDPNYRNQIFIAIDTGASPFEGYLHHKMGYRSRIVDRISRARGSHASPTSLIVGDPLYTEQISMYGSAGYTTPYAFHDIWLKSVPTSTTGTSIYQQWASGPSTTNMVLQLDSNGVKIGRGLPGFSDTYDSSKNSLDVIGSVGTRVRSVTGTSHTATTNDHTILISADGGSSFVLTLPNPATAPRREYVIKRVDSTLNLAYMKPTAGKVEGLDSMFVDRFSWVTIQSDSVNWHVVSRSSDTRLDALEQARNGFSYYQEFISNAAFTDGYIFGNASGAGAGVGRGVAVPAALQATNRPGITYARAGTTTTGRSGFYSDLNNRDNIILGASTLVYECSVAFPDLSDGTDRYQAIFGLHDVAGVNATDGVYFLYDEGGVSTGSAASGNWQIATSSAASRTFTTTSTAVAANTWYRLRIEINKTASEVRFYINGTLVGTHTTTIPSGVDRGTILQASINKSAGTNDRVFAIDYLLLNMRFNTPRY